MFLEFITSSFPTLMILFVLVVFMYVNRNADIPASGFFRAAVALLLLITILDYFERLFAGDTEIPSPIKDMKLTVKLRTFTSTSIYILRPILILMELLIISQKKKYRIIMIIIAVINTAVYLPALFGSHHAFYISDDNHWQGGVLSPTIFVVLLIYVGAIFFLSISHFKCSRSKSLIVLAIAVLAALDSIFEYTDALLGYATPVTAMCTLAYYIYLSVIYQQEMRETIAEKELHIAQDKLIILREQIQPHFIYNSLNIIRTLVRTDTETAVESIDNFSEYLQAHFRAIQDDHMVSFKQELENVMAYLSLVQADYTRKIEVVYELSEVGFNIPPLSLEPVVENAVKHGTGADGGTIRIASFIKDDCYIVSVTDDGTGKNNTLTEKQTKRLGVGIDNTRKRLAELCNGRLEMDKRPDGTTVSIIIPIPKEAESK
ncbi:MAG: histidine kinase [Ruminococcus sp.]|nr:histidine kinase [Ruminococcus sp.]